jgi:hypothetical protein
MANKIVLKHRSSDTAEPTGLLAGEIASNINASGKKLYVGTGTGNIVFADQTYVDNEIAALGDVSLSSASFSTSTGVITLTKSDASTVTVDIDGRFQPLDSDLSAIAALSPADGNFIVGSASGWVVESGATARTSLGLGTAATTASTDYATAAQGSNADTAFGWGNHASAGYATESYVTTAVANVVDAAPAALDTLNELAAALGDDANFAGTITTSIGTKLDSSTWTASAASGITSTQVSNWNTAYNWGDHSTEGYLTSYTETDTLASVTGRGATTATAVNIGTGSTINSVAILTANSTIDGGTY